MAKVPTKAEATKVAIAETPIKRKVGRPAKESLTVEQEIVALHNKLSKLNSKVNALEELVLELQANQNPTSNTVEVEEVGDYGNIGTRLVKLDVIESRIFRLDNNITEIKEMLHQLLDSIGEEE